MRITIALTLLAALAAPAFADLQNVQVGGSIYIRGNDWFNMRDSGQNDIAFVEQRTRLNVSADFTDNVSVFIEVDDYSVWGEDFRSSYLTGVDSRGPAYPGNAFLGPNGDPALFQAYIEAKEMWGTALQARIGRQEIQFGSGWLVGLANEGNYPFGVSFDALRLTYATDQFSIDAVAAKLAENSPNFEDGDADFYALYGSYLGIKDITLDAYWMFVRDAATLGVQGSLDVHTFGLRGAGTIDAFDFDAEVAYQLIDYLGASSDAWGANLEAGYTFDTAWSPRPFLGFAFFEGVNDDGDDAPFNRLFSAWEYGMFLDVANVDLSNCWVGRAGVGVTPCEKIKIQLCGAYFGLVEDFGGSSEAAAELMLSGTYNYSEDLSFGAGYCHLFALDALEDGTAFILTNGLTRPVFTDDADHLFFETKIKF